eukprot:TRINITY_DN6600_c0_g1_i9.p2 TRINITY_DN6600_c0_g1~~TRINITY_DN6600_c0_g1_i9.p2  ORF type:complete len:200 (+),score=-6.43 TRINITY_DN6600_c0_g1_i9:64-600(+)
MFNVNEFFEVIFFAKNYNQKTKKLPQPCSNLFAKKQMCTHCEHSQAQRFFDLAELQVERWNFVSGRCECSLYKVCCISGKQRICGKTQMSKQFCSLQKCSQLFATCKFYLIDVFQKKQYFCTNVFGNSTLYQQQNNSISLNVLYPGQYKQKVFLTTAIYSKQSNFNSIILQNLWQHCL